MDASRTPAVPAPPSPPEGSEPVAVGQEWVEFVAEQVRARRTPADDIHSDVRPGGSVADIGTLGPPYA